MSRRRARAERRGEAAPAGAEDLGAAYERELRRARPAAQRARGAYYTPHGVVAHLVARTLAPLLAGRRPREVAGLRVLDPACGGGAFLLGAYRHLLAWYLARRTAELPASRQRLRRDARGAWRLTAAERLRILERHLLGVDVDAGAIAVAREALLRCALEEEDAERARRRLEAWRRRPPPVLVRHVRVGDALAEGGAPGGVDAVLGNPPYVGAARMAVGRAAWRARCKGRYAAASGNWDLYCLFVERALELLRPGGRLGLVVPNKLASAGYAAGARAALAAQGTLESVRDYAAARPFRASVYPFAVVAAKRPPGVAATVRCERMATSGGRIGTARAWDLPHRAVVDGGRPWRLGGARRPAGPPPRALGACRPLGEVATVLGAATVAEAYQLAPLLGELRSPGDVPLVNSGLVDRHAVRWGVRPCRYLGRRLERPAVPGAALARLLPRRAAQARAPKVIVAGLCRVLECVLDRDGAWLAGKSTSIVLDAALDLRYLAALLGSKLVTAWFVAEYGGNALRGGYLRVGPPQLRTVPVMPVDAAHPGRRALHDALVALVDARIAAGRRLVTATGAAARRAGEQASTLDARIDAAVYRLYEVGPAGVAAIEATYRAALAGRA